MAASGVRTALAALTCVTAGAVLTVPAQAAPQGNGISVRPEALLTPDGTIRLFGTYYCTDSSSTGAVQISVKIVQGDFQLGTSGGAAVCDGTEHAWESHSKLSVLPIHEGAAVTDVRLQRVHFSGLLPQSIESVAVERRNVRVVARNR